MTPHEQLNVALSSWPDFGVEHTFLARLGSLALGAADTELFAAGDFYLACAALKGVPAAVKEVEAMLAARFGELGHFRLQAAELEDLRAHLLAELLVAPSSALPRLERYSGVGPLAGWLRVVATREVLSGIRRNQREPPRGDEALLGTLESPAESPELAVLKERYRGELSAAFRQAIGSLEPRQRNLLRQHYLDELSLEEVAAMYRVHRATAARWLAAARAELLERTRDEICRSLKLESFEVDSLMRLVQSRLDLSAGIFLSAQREPKTS